MKSEDNQTTAGFDIFDLNYDCDEETLVGIMLDKVAFYHPDDPSEGSERVLAEWCAAESAFDIVVEMYPHRVIDALYQAKSSTVLHGALEYLAETSDDEELLHRIVLYECGYYPAMHKAAMRIQNIRMLADIALHCEYDKVRSDIVLKWAQSGLPDEALLGFALNNSNEADTRCFAVTLLMRRSEKDDSEQIAKITAEEVLPAAAAYLLSRGDKRGLSFFSRALYESERPWADCDVFGSIWDLFGQNKPAAIEVAEHLLADARYADYEYKLLAHCAQLRQCAEIITLQEAGLAKPRTGYQRYEASKAENDGTRPHPVADELGYFAGDTTIVKNECKKQMIFELLDDWIEGHCPEEEHRAVLWYFEAVYEDLVEMDKAKRVAVDSSGIMFLSSSEKEARNILIEKYNAGAANVELLRQYLNRAAGNKHTFHYWVEYFPSSFKSRSMAFIRLFLFEMLCGGRANAQHTSPLHPNLAYCLCLCGYEFILATELSALDYSSNSNQQGTRSGDYDRYLMFDEVAKAVFTAAIQNGLYQSPEHRPQFNKALKRYLFISASHEIIDLCAEGDEELAAIFAEVMFDVFCDEKDEYYASKEFPDAKWVLARSVLNSNPATHLKINEKWNKTLWTIFEMGAV